MDVTIRRAEPEDAEQFQRLYGSARALAGTLQLPYPSVELWRKRLASFPAGDVMFGFEVEGTHKAYALRDGRYVDAHCMARLRAKPAPV